LIKASLIIPTYNRSDILSVLLTSISKQETVQEFEVIIVDNGSTDDTKSISLAYAERIKNFQYIYDGEPGLLTGRHKGFYAAKGEILSFLDDDVELNLGYIENLITLFNTNKEINFATGPCLPNYEITPPDWLNYFWDSVPEGKYCAWLSLLDFGNEIKIVSPNYVWGLNFCCRKKTVSELGGFNPDCIPKHLQEFQGDGETGLTQKAINSGMSALYCPGLSLHHHVSKERLTVEYFKKRAFYQGVCDSYTHLRNEHFNQTTIKFSRLKLFRNKLHPYYRWIKKIQVKDKSITLPAPIKELQSELEKSIQEGYQFHKERFYSNENVKSWVLKENYWNFKLPIDA
jgi:glycosyltransferase involved in cell wall biosynthesis